MHRASVITHISPTRVDGSSDLTHIDKRTKQHKVVDKAKFQLRLVHGQDSSELTGVVHKLLLTHKRNVLEWEHNKDGEKDEQCIAARHGKSRRPARQAALLCGRSRPN
eukprot:4086551-Amphidinium_carterae.1